jgi:hypothetical protein
MAFARGWLPTRALTGQQIISSEGSLSVSAPLPPVHSAVAGAAEDRFPGATWEHVAPEATGFRLASAPYPSPRRIHTQDMKCTWDLLSGNASEKIAFATAFDGKIDAC